MGEPWGQGEKKNQYIKNLAPLPLNHISEASFLETELNWFRN